MKQEKIDKNDFWIKEYKRSLNAMCREVSMNKITFTQFQLYCRAIEGYIQLGTEDYLPYAISLCKAQVLCYDRISEELYRKNIQNLGKIIDDKRRKDLENITGFRKR